MRHQNVRQVATALQAVQRTATFMEVAGTPSYTQMVVQRPGCAMRSYTQMVVQCAAVQRAAGLGALLHPEISSG